MPQGKILENFKVFLLTLFSHYLFLFFISLYLFITTVIKGSKPYGALHYIYSPGTMAKNRYYGFKYLPLQNKCVKFKIKLRCISKHQSGSSSHTLHFTLQYQPHKEGQIIHLMHKKLCKYFEQCRLKSGTWLTPSFSVIKVNTHKSKYTCKEQIL